MSTEQKPAPVAVKVQDDLVDALRNCLWMIETFAGTGDENYKLIYAARDALAAHDTHSALVAGDGGIADAVIQFLVKHGMLDVRPEYHVSDVLSALSDNFEPAPSMIGGAP